MPDFEPKDAWKNMVLILQNVVKGYADFQLCVEAGNVSDWIKMDPDALWTGTQIIKSHL